MRPKRLSGSVPEKLEHLRQRARTAGARFGAFWARARQWGRDARRTLVWLAHSFSLTCRRALMLCHEALADRRLVGPGVFLIVSGALAVTLTAVTLYSTSYAVYVDGKNVGYVADRSTVDQAVAAVEAQGTRMLGYEYNVDSEITYRFAVTLRSDLDGVRELEDYFYNHMDDVDDELRQYEIFLDGQTQGVIGSKAEFNGVLQRLRDVYTNENTTDTEFVEEITVVPVLADNVLTGEEMYEHLTENTTGETTYEVVKGDTFSLIAYRSDMSVSELKALNPGVDVDKLSIGQILNVKESIPRLSVRTVDHITYHQSIPCPVETRNDSNLYVGSSRIITQGAEGDALITADVMRVNGIEKNRTVLSSETLLEPTVTVKAVGTKEKPKTASSGRYKWPCSGRITSYFGYRRIFGSSSYHSGIDISCAYGTSIKAADGGKVTFSGYKGAYGNLVIITHDNGQQTYYGHCSSLLVSTGTRVYQGQVIARVGSTGRSTGNHCHFEVRIGGSAVNPLNYLR